MAEKCITKDFVKYTQTLQKAINAEETPVKQKHIRSAIIETFHTQGADIFWAIALRLPYMDDRNVAWKLCHVIHKILREGHPLCLEQSQPHRKELYKIGTLWGNVKESYGKLIQLYTTLLITKLEFHRKNPRFPGHLSLSHEEFESISAKDTSNYFDMSAEMFDYLDNILDLQEAVFASLNMAQSNSMTSQYKLSPLVPCIQEASILYDYCVKMLIKLHGALPSETLADHRQRFLKQFKALKQFYENISNQQYFRDLIAIPLLPENPPNLVQAYFSTHVTQEVVITPDEPLILEGGLTNISNDGESVYSYESDISLAVHQDVINERDFFRSQCMKLKLEFDKVLMKNQHQINVLQSKVTSLKTDFAIMECNLLQEREIKEDIISQAFTVAQSQNSEQKVKDEKLTKLNDAYYLLRSDHIAKLREKADMEKKFNGALKQIEEFYIHTCKLEAKIANLELQLSKTKQKHTK